MVFLEYINFEHNTVAAELVRQTYDTPPLAFVHSYGSRTSTTASASKVCWWISATACAISPRTPT